MRGNDSGDQMDRCGEYARNVHILAVLLSRESFYYG